jgi:hypothetical protein
MQRRYWRRRRHGRDPDELGGRLRSNQAHAPTSERRSTTMVNQPVNEIEKVPAVDLRKGFLWGAKVLSYMVYVYLILVEIVLVIGFFLLLFGANQSAGFTQWAYRNLDRVMAPFRGIFTPIELGTTSGDVEAVFDTSVLFAMIIYGILALLLNWVIGWLTSRQYHLAALEADVERRKYEQELREAMQARAAQPTVVPVTQTTTPYPQDAPNHPPQ